MKELQKWRRGWDTHLVAFANLPCFQQDAGKPDQFWRFLRSRILELFQLFRINSTNFGPRQTPKTPKRPSASSSPALPSGGSSSAMPMEGNLAVTGGTS